MIVARAVAVFASVVAAEVAGIWLVWRAVPQDHDWLWIAIALAALAAYVVVVASSPDPLFHRIAAGYGAVFAGLALAWGMALHGEPPDRFDAAGTLLCLAGAGALAILTRRRQLDRGVSTTRLKSGGTRTQA